MTKTLTLPGVIERIDSRGFIHILLPQTGHRLALTPPAPPNGLNATATTAPVSSTLTAVATSMSAGHLPATTDRTPLRSVRLDTEAYGQAGLRPSNHHPHHLHQLLQQPPRPNQHQHRAHHHHCHQQQQHQHGSARPIFTSDSGATNSGLSSDNYRFVTHSTNSTFPSCSAIAMNTNGSTNLDDLLLTASYRNPMPSQPDASTGEADTPHQTSIVTACWVGVQ
ncbi:unnamed protein product [Protopolystoma xenopodis]|uniref:Uncharacterized protein n=1 Tax=Protopolystoma xenopodis TaxID=117903 RepID=A0A448XDU2_9PLAT|nr:unnamed protein product [Protopolystoma xenopodis]